MIGLLLPTLAATLASIVLGGSLSRCVQARLAWWPVLVGIFGLELVLYNPPVDHQPWALAAGPWLWVATKPIMLAVLARNAQLDAPRRLAWVAIMLGVGLNALAVVANGGHMPQSMDAAAAVWGSDYVRPDIYSGRLENVRWMEPSTPLAWLCDILPEPAWLPRANVLSVGDVTLALGVAMWMFSVTRASSDRVRFGLGRWRVVEAQSRV
jgi:Family of unknown function (DUF5317)